MLVYMHKQTVMIYYLQIQTHSTKFPHEIENCDLILNNQFTAWVKIPTIDDTTDTEFFMYYGNPSAANQEDIAGGVWDSNYVGVWHLNNNDFLDSTSNNIHGTNSGSTGL